MPTPSALLLSPETPYPLHGGGALRTACMLNYLAQRYALDLVLFRHRPEQDPLAAIPSGLIRRATVIDLPPNRRDMASRLLRNAGRFLREVPPLTDRFRGFAPQLAAFARGYRYRVSVIEHFWAAEYQTQLAAVSDSVVLNLHNIESVLHATSAAADPWPAALGHRRFSQASRRLEKRWFPRFQQLLTASAADSARVTAIAPAAQVCVVPNAIPLVPRPDVPEENVIAFSGNLEYHPNQLAVEFFASRVWPALHQRHPELIWRLIGMNPHAVAPALKGLPNVETTGSVADAIAQLARARLVVAPLLSGSGTRLKIIEAWAAGRAVVSTPIGAEGLPARDGQNIVLAQTPQEFLSRIELLLSSPERRRELGTAGHKEFLENLSWPTAWKMLDLSRAFPY